MRYYGKIGFVETQQTAPGVYTMTKVTERMYYGDVLRWSPRSEVSNDKANDDLNVSNQISIVADAYAKAHFPTIKYIEWAGVKWRVRNINVNYPRLVLEIGGIYPEQEEENDDSPEYQD